MREANQSDVTDERLAAQYESYPYPRRDPADESRRLVIGNPSHLREVDHWVFGAARPMSRPLEALVAGGGSGDGTIMLGQQLASAGRPGRITYLDRSATALGTARARAERRGLTNIRFEQGSLLDLALFDGLRVPVPLPTLAPAILRLIDGARSVGDIAATLADRGVRPEAFGNAWTQSWAMLNGLNRLLLRPPA